MTVTNRPACLSFATLLAITAAMLGCGSSGSGNSGDMNPGKQNPAFLYVVNSQDATVSGFAIAAAGGGLTSIGAPVATGRGPMYAAASGDGKFLYVANLDISSSSVSAYRVDAATGALTPTSPATFNVTNDDQPLGIAVDPASKRVYTANVGSVSTFDIDPTTGALSQVPGSPIFSSQGAEPQDLKVSANGQFLYVTNGPANTVSAYTFDATGLPVIAGPAVSAGNFPLGIVVDPASKFVYVANMNSDSVSSYTITPGSGALVPTDTAPLPNQCVPQELTVDPSAKFLFVSCSGGGADSIAQFSINSATGALTAISPAFSTGSNTTPRGIVVDPSGKFLYSTLNTANQLSTAGIGATGTLTMSGMSGGTGTSPVGVAISVPH